MTTQIVAKPSGMVTEPNKVGQFPPGAFSNCKNVAIRSFGVMEQVRKFANLTGASFAGPLVGGIYTASDGPVTVVLYEHTTAGTWTLLGINATATGGFGFDSEAVGSPWSGYITNDCRTGLVLMRDRVVVTGAVRSFVFDLALLSGGTIGVGAPRDCAVYQTCLYNRSTTSGVANDPAYLGPNEHFSATSVLRYKFSDGYEIQSPPAIPSDYANLSTTLPQVRSGWSVKSDLAATVGGVQEIKHDIYRTRAQSVGYDSINNKYKPISTGSSFYLSKTETRGSTFQTGIQDTTLPSTLGEALLTNVSVGGASALPLPPPPAAKTCCAFRGHAFYANRWDPATFTLLNPYYWGFMNLASASFVTLAQGVGYRFTTGGAQTAVTGNPTVTGFPVTTGVLPGQIFNVYRQDTGALVTTNNEVLSATSTTVTGTTNVTYSGAVRVEIIDQIEVCGTKRSAQGSPQEFVTQLFFGTGNINLFCDVAAVGLEPITTENPVGVYPNFVPTGGMTFRMRTNAPFTIRGTNGYNFSPGLPAISAPVLSIPGKQSENSFAWSENNEPENVPPSNYAFVGTGEIHKIVATRDCLWFFCSDGLFRLSGAGGSVGTEYDWVIDPVDPSLVISNPMCAVAYREFVYALTNRGVVSISSEGTIRELSDGRINPSWAEGGGSDPALQNSPWFIPAFPPAVALWPWVAADGHNDEIWVRCTQGNNANTDKIWVYNTKTDTWCIRNPSYNGTEVPIIGVYNSTLQVMLAPFASTTQFVISSRIGNSTDYETAEVTFQPFYGGSHGAPYTQKHWQDINLSFHSPQSTSTSTLTLRSQGELGLIAGTRTIPPSAAFPLTSEKSRVGFTVPRAWPAVANSIAPHMTITSPSASGLPEVGLQPIKLEGMQISYVDFTEQRVAR